MKWYQVFGWTLSFVALIFLVSTLKDYRVEPVYYGFILSDYKIVIDPGHGGVDGGATYDGVLEKDLALNISKKLRDRLEQLGATVLLTREGDYDLSDGFNDTIKNQKRADLANRVKLINDSEADFVVSIHLNAVNDPVWHGAQTFYDSENKAGQRLAEVIQEAMVSRLQNTTRSAQAVERIFVLKEAEIPAALVEVGFLSNEKERAALQRDDYQNEIVTSVFYGIISYLTEVNIEE